MKNIRLANLNDLPKLKIMFTEVVKDLHENGIDIWNEFYPYEMFEADIARNELYIMENENLEIVAAFSLTNETDYTQNYKWQSSDETSINICRFAISKNHKGKGFGKLAMEKAEEIANLKGFKHMRLSVYDKNFPALSLYLKLGYQIVEGSTVLSKNRLFLGMEKTLLI